jgi:RNA polymerase sigma-70 factor (ECF subfamily)
METHQSLEEVDLVRGLQERDPKAMEVFLERYSPLLHHCISQFAGRDLERDDLWQELLKYSLERLDGGHFDPQRGALGTWLYRVAWCRCVDLQRRLKARQAPGSRLPQEAIPEQDAEGPSPLEVAADAEIAGEVRDALTRLEPQERNLLELRYLNELSLREVSARLSLTLETTKYRLNGAKRSLRRLLVNSHQLDGGVGLAG